MNKSQVVQTILASRSHNQPLEQATAFAPSNIALTKYWGKRNAELNLPLTPSLSISLADKGTSTTIKLIPATGDEYSLNNNPVDPNTEFSKRLHDFLDLFRVANTSFKVETHSNIPIAAGLASSASGFCALVKALDKLFTWELSLQEMSILARLGSGSACRSISNGFVIWHKGEREDGMDCYAEHLTQSWSDLRIGLLLLSSQEKTISSRVAMQRSLTTSRFFKLWPEQVASDLQTQLTAIASQNFQHLGQSAETNSLAMHATMHTSIPPVNYWLPDTVAAMRRVWGLRSTGLPVYFTQDAGPNLKLLFLAADTATICSAFAEIEVIQPFADN